MIQALLEKGVNAFGSDVYAAGTYVYGSNLKAPVGYVEASDALNPVTVSNIKYELGGAYANDSLNWIENAIPLTTTMGVQAFSREVMEFTCDQAIKVYYSSKPRTQLELVDDVIQLIGNESLEVIHF